MGNPLLVEDFFDLKSPGPVVVFKFRDFNAVLSHGATLKTTRQSEWKITGISGSTIKHSEVPCGRDSILISYHVEHLTGDKVLVKGDLVYVESEKGSHPTSGL